MTYCSYCNTNKREFQDDDAWVIHIKACHENPPVQLKDSDLEGSLFEETELREIKLFVLNAQLALIRQLHPERANDPLFQDVEPTEPSTNSKKEENALEIMEVVLATQMTLNQLPKETTGPHRNKIDELSELINRLQVLQGSDKSREGI